MNAVIKPTSSGHYVDDMPNEEYHKPENGFSTSSLKQFRQCPAILKWSQAAPKDESKLKAVDFGTDFHTYFLEPERFKEQYKVMPTFNRRKPAEKQAELDLIAEWESNGIVPVTAEDMIKLEAMRTSALAHPTVKAIMDLQGIAERSFFWEDETGITCKCRPDWYVEDFPNGKPPFMPDDCDVLVADAKTIYDMSKIQNQVEHLDYYIQDPFYSNGIEQVTGKKVCFVFMFVSTTMSLGRYPVEVVMLEETARFDGFQEIRNTLDEYAEMTQLPESAWQTVTMIDRPAWAMNNDDI